jgi:hypothetical protein
MSRYLLSVGLSLLITTTAFAQPYRKMLISAEKGINLGNTVVDSLSITPGAKAPWSAMLKTLKGGKQEGVQLLTIDNGRMRITIIPTRGMGILNVTLGDLSLGWKSPVTEVVHPKLVNLQLRGGLGWLEGFNEWLCRCGLENTGQAGPDEIVNNVGDKTTVDLTLHGKIANIPASEVEIIVEKQSPYRITVRGVVHEKMLFGPKLELVTEISTQPGSNAFRIRDTVTNKGSQPQEYQVLYHYNFGKPLLGEGAKLHVPVEQVTPYNTNAARDVKTWNSFAAPKPGYVEQVYLMRTLEDQEGNVPVLLHDAKADRGVLLTYAKKELPYLTLWKNTGADEDGYVIGIEPGVSYPNSRKVERAAKRVPSLAGGASHTMTMEFHLLPQRASVAAVIAQIDSVQKIKAAVIQSKPGEP